MGIINESSDISINQIEIEFLADQIKEGLIFIDTEGTIKIYNAKAKEIFGLGHRWTQGHPAGKLEEGDFIIIADNYLGRDDGGLEPSDLMRLGINDQTLKLGATVIMAGEYLGNHTNTVFRCWEPEDNSTVHEMFARYKDRDVFIRIDRNLKVIDIKVEEETYTMDYYNAIGHMVILKKDSGTVKFFQAFGYTARGEAIKNIISGTQFMEKSKSSGFQVTGKNIFEIHDNSEAIIEFYQASKGGTQGFKNRFTEINGFPVRCSLAPFESGGSIKGAVLIVEDLSTLQQAFHERDEALSYVAEINNLLENNIAAYDEFNEFLGESLEIRRVKQLAFKAAKTNSTILLLGESGTGKTVLANLIHNASKRKLKPFIHVNCAAMPEMLLESELFGYEKGAFTGAATNGKEGLFRIAEGGTIFLDEIAEMNLSSQVKLLKVLQNRSFYKVGGTEEIKADVRIIAATNKIPELEVENGNLREDLYYRINVFPIMIPPLRDRKIDITYLANKLTQIICDRMELPIKLLTSNFQARLLEYSWPGNVRELENILERAINIADGNELDVQHLPNIQGLQFKDNVEKARASLQSILEASEKNAIIEALSFTENDRAKAMKILKIGKTKFYQKLKKYEIN